jgi:hypothetical protein
LGDVDGDGDLDVWVASFFEPDTVWLNQNCFNKDGDAFTDYEEYIADTDHTDSNDFIIVTEISITNMPVEVSFPSSASRFYSLQYNDYLVTGVWVNVQGQTNVAGVGGTQMLVDTLMGDWVHPWKLKRATKQVSHPKFYLFDCGVARALSGRLPYPPSPEELGPLFETHLFHEVRAFVAYEKLRYPLYFWRSYDGVEVDLLCETQSGFVAIEMKAGTQWEARFNRGLNRMRSELGEKNVTCYGVYQGDRPASWGEVSVLPQIDFLKRLWGGDILR